MGSSNSTEEEKWTASLAELVGFVEQYQRAPSARDSDEMRLADWATEQQMEVKEGTMAANHVNRFAAWTGFMEKYSLFFGSDAKWAELLSEVGAFVEEHKRAPVARATDWKEGVLAQWVCAQKRAVADGGMAGNGPRLAAWSDLVEKYPAV
jgi:hypothetical protein